MRFEWDEAKRQTNLQKHGLDLLRGASLFSEPQLYTYPSPRRGEARFVTVGLLQDEFVALVWTPRGGATRLISLRRARNAEKRAYRALFG
jgi:uncharacterized protein